jgi:ribonuclease T1
VDVSKELTMYYFTATPPQDWETIARLAEMRPPQCPDKKTPRAIEKLKRLRVGNLVMKLHIVCGLVVAWLLVADDATAASQNSSKGTSTAAIGTLDEQTPQTDGKAEPRPVKRKAGSKDQALKLPAGVPAKVGTVLQYIDEHGGAPEGYEGGRVFGNFEGLLPKRDARGRSIRYHEWDVNPKVRGRNRGPERLVTSSDGSAYYTADHYKSFKKIR